MSMSRSRSAKIQPERHVFENKSTSRVGVSGTFLEDFMLKVLPQFGLTKEALSTPKTREEWLERLVWPSWKHRVDVTTVDDDVTIGYDVDGKEVELVELGDGLQARKSDVEHVRKLLRLPRCRNKDWELVEAEVDWTKLPEEIDADTPLRVRAKDDFRSEWMDFLKARDVALVQTSDIVVFVVITITQWKNGRQLVKKLNEEVTKSERKTYVEHVADVHPKGREWVEQNYLGGGQKPVFVTHAWMSPWTDLVEALQADAERMRDKRTSYWIDVLCKNQWVVNSGDTEMDLENSVSSANRLVIVLCSPWNDLFVLRRIWCMFEIMNAIRADVPISVTMTNREIRSELKQYKGSRRKIIARINESVSHFDIRRAEATFRLRGDREYILALVARALSDELEFSEAMDIAIYRFNLIVRLALTQALENFLVDRGTVDYWVKVLITIPSLRMRIWRTAHTYNVELIAELAKTLHRMNMPGYPELYREALFQRTEVARRQTHQENFKEFCQAKGECVPHHTTQHPDVCRGLSVGYIKNLAQKHRLGEYKTKHVVRDFVKPKTKDEQSRFIDHSSERENATNVAEVFISHCWAGDFRDVLDGIQELGDDRIVWLDVFCVNQHGDGSDDARKQNKEDVDNFKVVLKSCSSLLLIISKIVQNRCSVGSCFVGMSICRKKLKHLPKEIEKKIPFFRIWCLNELFNAHMFYKDKIFMLPGRNPPSIFKELSELVDVERAEATKQSDIQLVQGWIKDACGFEELNRTIKRVVANVEWNSGDRIFQNIRASSIDKKS